jgi:hypothetical protein
MGYIVRYPAHFDGEAAVIEAKGWLDGVVIEAAGSEYRPLFYDEVRLAQETRDALAQDGFFAERSVVVVQSVTREHIDAAVERLSRGGFKEIV